MHFSDSLSSSPQFPRAGFGSQKGLGREPEAWHRCVPDEGAGRVLLKLCFPSWG